MGGGSVLIFGMANWLGKVWANRILEKEKSKYSKEIEKYKSELEISLNRANALQDKSLYISKVQYDNEYKIYQEIWGLMHNAIVSTLMLYPALEDLPNDHEIKEKYQLEKYQKYTENYNNYSVGIDKYAPFYKEDFYKDFIEIRSLCHKFGLIFKRYEFDLKHNLSCILNKDAVMTEKEDDEIYNVLPQKIEAKRDKLQKEIREYLLGLQLKG